MGYVLEGGGWTKLDGGWDSMKECEGVGYGEGIIGQGFAPMVWDLVYIAEISECGVCEKVVDRNGFFILVNGGVRPDERGFECGGDLGLSRLYASVGWLWTREGERT